MFRQNYCIAGIDIVAEKEIVDEEWKKFTTISLQQYHLTICKAKTAEIFYGIEKLNMDDRHSTFFERNEFMFVEDNWKKISFYPLQNRECITAFLIQAFYAHAAQHHMIQFHSSLIDYQGHGLMFLGPSGIGKTTQAELWNQYCDALIINGDIVFVQETEEAFLGWGTPWHGSSPYCENTNVPVDALIILKQAPENSIRKLESFEKVTAVSNSVFYPRWLENGMELCLETLDHLLSKIPVYELSCRPDEEAVELTEKTIFGREH